MIQQLNSLTSRINSLILTLKKIPLPPLFPHAHYKLTRKEKKDKERWNNCFLTILAVISYFPYLLSFHNGHVEPYLPVVTCPLLTHNLSYINNKSLSRYTYFPIISLKIYYLMKDYVVTTINSRLWSTFPRLITNTLGNRLRERKVRTIPKVLVETLSGSGLDCRNNGGNRSMFLLPIQPIVSH